MLKTSRLSARTTAAIAATVWALSPAAHGMVVDNGSPVSAYWTPSVLFKTIMEWNASLRDHPSVRGAGIGHIRTLAAMAGDNSGGRITKAVFTAYCGLPATQSMQRWRPPLDPTRVAHMKVIGLASVASADICYVARPVLHEAMNYRMQIAQQFVNTTNSQKKSTLNLISIATNNVLNSLEQDFRTFAVYQADVRSLRTKYNGWCEQMGASNNINCDALKRTIAANIVRQGELEGVMLQRLNTISAWLRLLAKTIP